MPIYMQIAGLKGDVTAKGFAAWFSIYSFSWGMSSTGGRPQPASFNVQFAPVTSASKIFLDCATGKHIDSVIIAELKPEGPEYFRVTLTDVLISSYSIGASDGEAGPPMLTVAFEFNKILERYAIAMADGSVRYESNFFDFASGVGG
jgi:type VI secretion system secreted protein Hcp